MTTSDSTVCPFEPRHRNEGSKPLLCAYSLSIRPVDDTAIGGLDAHAADRILGLASVSHKSPSRPKHTPWSIVLISLCSKTFLILGMILTGYTAFRAFRDPNASPGGPAAQAQAAMMNNGVLPRFYLPIIGDFAER